MKCWTTKIAPTKTLLLFTVSVLLLVLPFQPWVTHGLLSKKKNLLRLCSPAPILGRSDKENVDPAREQARSLTSSAVWWLEHLFHLFIFTLCTMVSSIIFDVVLSSFLILLLPILPLEWEIKLTFSQLPCQKSTLGISKFWGCPSAETDVVSVGRRHLNSPKKSRLRGWTIIYREIMRLSSCCWI